MLIAPVMKSGLLLTVARPIPRSPLHPLTRMLMTLEAMMDKMRREWVMVLRSGDCWSRCGFRFLASEQGESVAHASSPPAPDRRQIVQRMYRLASPVVFGKAWAFAYHSTLPAHQSLVAVFQEVP